MTSPTKLKSLITASTFLILFGAIITWVFAISISSALGIFGTAAKIVGIVLVLVLLLEARGGVRNLVRVDLFMFISLYLLTFLEFLFPQELATQVRSDNARTAVAAVLLTFVGIALGRHIFPLNRRQVPMAAISVSPTTTFYLLIGCAFLGHLYMLLAVNFDIFEMLRQMQRPRFTQPWSRGRFGSLSTLLNELSLLVYLLPPLAGAIFAQAKRYPSSQKIVAAFLLCFVFYYAFVSGTRNLFLIHVATSATAYAILLPKFTIRTALKIGVPVLLISAFALQAMLAVRTLGATNLSAIFERSEKQAVFVDMNLVNIAQITDVIPRIAPYLGFEVLWIALVRPIPRALWPGKPEGLSFSVNDAVRVGDHMTVSASFPGELWMAGGFLAIALGSLAAGAFAGYWDRFGARASSSLQLTAYAIGFFPAGLMMRSFMSSAPAFLPLIALLVFVKFFKAKQSRRYKPVGRRRHDR